MKYKSHVCWFNYRVSRFCTNFFSHVARYSLYTCISVCNNQINWFFIWFAFNCLRLFFVHSVLIGNKCDLEDQREVQYEEGKQLADSWGVPFFETSAKSRINNKECYYELVRQLHKKRHPEPSNEKNKQNRKISFKNLKKKCTIL